MIKLYDVLLTDILPGLFETESVKLRAFAEADRAVRRKVYGFAEKTKIYKNLEILDEAVLDLLAMENKVQYYSNDLPRELKAQLIRKSIAWHEKAGTVSAMQELVNAVFGSGKVFDWYEYGGAPFKFKVNADISFTPDTLEFFKQLLSKVKPTEASLDLVEVSSDSCQPICMSFGMAAYVIDIIEMDWRTE